MDHHVDRYRIEPGRTVDLSAIPTDDSDSHDKKATQRETERLVGRLVGLQERLYAEGRHRLLVVLQAIDTGGKDGTISRVFGPLNPQGVRIAPFKAPTEEELAHDYLWRVHSEVPRNGEICVFNRSHYEDVLVVRVHELVPRDRWRRRYRHIRDFERMLVDEGTTLVKLFLNISKDEQRERLQARVDTPEKRWKYNPRDLVERTKWDDYRAAYEDMLSETSTGWAPWYCIPADRKWFRDHLVTQLMVETIERLDPQWPPSPEGVEGTVVV